MHCTKAGCTERGRPLLVGCAFGLRTASPFPTESTPKSCREAPRCPGPDGAVVQLASSRRRSAPPFAASVRRLRSPPSFTASVLHLGSPPAFAASDPSRHRPIRESRSRFRPYSAHAPPSGMRSPAILSSQTGALRIRIGPGRDRLESAAPDRDLLRINGRIFDRMTPENSGLASRHPVAGSCPCRRRRPRAAAGGRLPAPGARTPCVSVTASAHVHRD